MKLHNSKYDMNRSRMQNQRLIQSVRKSNRITTSLLYGMKRGYFIDLTDDARRPRCQVVVWQAMPFWDGEEQKSIRGTGSV